MADNNNANPNDTSGAFTSADAGVPVEESSFFDSNSQTDPQFGVPHTEPGPLDGATIIGEDPSPSDILDPRYANSLPVDVDNPTSYRYFQQKFDQSQVDNQALTAQMVQMQQVMNQLSSGQFQVNQSAPPLGSGGQALESGNSLKKPEQPQLPTDFDQTDAFFDPESESYQARNDQMDYLNKMGSYIEDRLGQMDQAFNNIATREAEKARNDAWNVQLKDTFNMSDGEQAAFHNMMNDPEMLKLENMVKIFRSMYGGQVEPVAPRPRVQITPTPSSRVVSGAREAARSPSDSIMDQMQTQFGSPSDLAFGRAGK